MAQQGGGCLKGFLFGCGFLVLLVVIGAGTLFYYRHKLIASTVNVVVGQWLADAGLPHEERTKIAAELDRLTAALREGNVSPSQVSQVMEQSDVFYLLLMEGLQRAELPVSSLPPEAQSDARLQLQRVQRGLVEDKLTTDQVLQALETVRPQGSDGRSEIQTNEWESLVAGARSLADSAAIPSETYEVDLSAQVRDLVDALLGVTSSINRGEPSAPMDVAPASAALQPATP